MRADYRRQLLTTADGGTIALDWFRGCDAAGALPATAPVLLVLHGLTGALSLLRFREYIPFAILMHCQQ